jgi:hypothetical protein
MNWPACDKCGSSTCSGACRDNRTRVRDEYTDDLCDFCGTRIGPSGCLCEHKDNEDDENDGKIGEA